MKIEILVITIILSIVLGFTALAISFILQRKYEINYIKSYFYHQIFIFLFGFYGLLGTITAHFLLADLETKGALINHLFSFLPFIGVPFMIVAWYMFIKISFELVGKKISLQYTLWFYIVLILVFLLFGFLVPVLDFFTVPQAQINTRIFLFFIFIEFITLVIVYTNYFVFNKNVRDKKKVTFIKYFALTNLILYLISVLFLVAGEKNLKFIAVYTVLYFSKDIIPLLLLNQYLKQNYIHPANRIQETTKKTFIERFGISKREAEIIEEIVKGKTNKEISDDLFISVQTVKDHIHNIFLKTEVKNRVQLTNLIREYNL